MTNPIYTSQMQSIAERVNRPAKLIQCVQMFNEEEFAPLVLRSIYDRVDQIIVIEGAIGQRANATPDGHSTDKTIEIIEDFKRNHDPDKKLLSISIRRPWKSLEEMKQVFLDMTNPGDWLIINDADEIYIPNDIDRIRKAIDLYPHATEFVPSFLHFYRDFQHIAVPGPEWQTQHQRIIKNQGNMRYVSHPVATMADGHCSYFSPHMQHRRYTVPNMFIYHYGYARSNMNQIMRDKQAYYDLELAKHGGANKKFDAKVKTWFDGTEPLLRFDGQHPSIMLEHPMLHQIEDCQLKIEKSLNWRNNEFYKLVLEGGDIPNIWLCMTQRAVPYMSMYSNTLRD